MKDELCIQTFWWHILSQKVKNSSDYLGGLACKNFRDGWREGRTGQKQYVYPHNVYIDKISYFKNNHKEFWHWRYPWCTLCHNFRIFYINIVISVYYHYITQNCLPLQNFFIMWTTIQINSFTNYNFKTMWFYIKWILRDKNKHEKEQAVGAYINFYYQGKLSVLYIYI